MLVRHCAMQGRIMDLQAKAAALVDSIRRKRLERAQAGTQSKSTTSLDNSIRNARRCLDQMLMRLAAQEQVLAAAGGGEAAGSGGGPYDVNDILDRGVPWVYGGAGEQAAARLWLQYNLAAAERARCAEQHDIIRAKACNALSWLRHRIAVCHRRVVAAAQRAASAAQQVAACDAASGGGNEAAASAARAWAAAQGSSLLMSQALLQSCIKHTEFLRVCQEERWVV